VGKGREFIVASELQFEGKINYLREKYFSMQSELFPMIVEEIGELTAKK